MPDFSKDCDENFIMEREMLVTTKATFTPFSPLFNVENFVNFKNMSWEQRVDFIRS